MTFLQAKQILNRYISSKSYTDDPKVGQTINFAAQQLIESGYWKNNLINVTLTSSDGQTLEAAPTYQSIIKAAPRQAVTGILSNRSSTCGKTQIKSNHDGTYQLLPPVEPGTEFNCVVIRAFKPLVEDTDEVYPSNINALRYAVQAVVFDDVYDLERAKVYWDQAYRVLNSEAEQLQLGEQKQLNLKANFGTKFPNII